jgi:hypothetical protein
MAAMYTAGQEQEKWLRSATAWQKRPSNTQRAGTEIANYLERYLNVSQRSNPVADAFMNVVDEGLAGHCRPDKFDKGVLYIHCSPGPCLHQLRIDEAEMIEKIKTLCPKAKLRAIRFKIKN